MHVPERYVSYFCIDIAAHNSTYVRLLFDLDLRAEAGL